MCPLGTSVNHQEFRQNSWRTSEGNQKTFTQWNMIQYHRCNWWCVTWCRRIYHKSLVVWWKVAGWKILYYHIAQSYCLGTFLCCWSFHILQFKDMQVRWNWNSQVPMLIPSPVEGFTVTNMKIAFTIQTLAFVLNGEWFRVTILWPLHQILRLSIHNQI